MNSLITRVISGTAIVIGISVAAADIDATGIGKERTPGTPR